MTVLYIISKFLTFPGAYLHAFLEHVACRSCKCLIESDGYLRFDEACGHVEHTLPDSKGKAAYIALMPGTLGFIGGVLMTAAGLVPLTTLGITAKDSLPMFIIYILLSYVGLSSLCNLFPLVEDALNSWEMIYGKNGANIFVKIILFIPSVINVAGAFAEKYCVNILLAAAIAAAGVYYL